MGYGLRIAVLIMMIFVIALYVEIVMPIIPSWFTATETDWLNLIVFGFWIFGFMATGLSFARR